MGQEPPHPRANRARILPREAPVRRWWLCGTRDGVNGSLRCWLLMYPLKCAWALACRVWRRESEAQPGNAQVELRKETNLVEPSRFFSLWGHSIIILV